MMSKSRVALAGWGIVLVMVAVMVVFAYATLFATALKAFAGPGICKSHVVSGSKAATMCFYPNINWSSTAHQVKCGGAGIITLNTYKTGYSWKNAKANCVDYTWDSKDVATSTADLYFFGIKIRNYYINCVRFGYDGHWACQ